MDNIDTCLWGEVISYLDPIMVHVIRHVNKYFYTSVAQINERLDIKYAELGYLNILKWLNYPLNKKVSFAAAQYGHLHILEWYGKKLKNKLTRYAAKGGQIEIYDWLKSKGCEDVDIHHISVKHGQLDFFKHVMPELYRYDSLCFTAVQYGHVEMAEWLMSKGIEYHNPSDFLGIKRNHIQMLEFLHSKGIPVHPATCKGGARVGLEVVKWGVDHGCELTQSVIGIAAGKGDIPLVEYCLENGLRLTEHVADEACHKGQFECLKWLVEKGCELSQYCCDNAAWNGSLDILIWLVEKGQEIDREVQIFAAEDGHLHILKWLAENGYELNKNELFLSAICDGHIEILEWLNHKYSGEGDPISTAISGGSLESFKWLKSQGYKTNIDIIEEAIHYGSYKILLYVLDKNSVLTEENIIDIIEHNHKIMKDVIRSGCKLPDNICEIISPCCGVKIVQMIVISGYEFTRKALEKALMDNPEVVKWALNREFATLDDELAAEIIIDANVEILQIMLDKGYKIHSYIRSNAITGCNDDIVDWYDKNVK